MIVYTASRLGALVYVARNEKKNRSYIIGENNKDKNKNKNKNNNKKSNKENSTNYN